MTTLTSGSTANFSLSGRQVLTLTADNNTTGTIKRTQYVESSSSKTDTLGPPATNRTYGPFGHETDIELTCTYGSFEYDVTGTSLVTAETDPVTGRIRYSTGRQDDFTRRLGATVVDWSASFGALTLATGGTAAACALDTAVQFDGKPTVKCTFSTTATDTFIGRYTLADGVSFKGFKNIVIPIKITAADVVGTVGTAANPLGVWLKTAGGRQYRLRLVCDGVGPDGWHYFSYNRTETSGLVTLAGGPAAMTDLDNDTITIIDIIHAAGSGIVSNAYPVWFGPILRDAIATPVVSLRLDGEYDSQYNLALPILQRYGLAASLMLTHSNIGTAGYMSVSQIDEMYDAGCEVGLHTYDSTKMNGYANATDWPSGVAIANDIQAGYAAQRTNGWYRGIGTLVEGYTGAYFSGATTLARQKIIRRAMASAGVDVMCNLRTSGLQKNQIGASGARPLLVSANVSLASATVVADVVAQINQVAASGEWLIILAHEIVEDSVTPTGNKIKVSDFDAICAAIASADVECLPIGEAYAQTYF